jgi:hypothetical protein
MRWAPLRENTPQNHGCLAERALGFAFCEVCLRGLIALLLLHIRTKYAYDTGTCCSDSTIRVNVGENPRLSPAPDRKQCRTATSAW